MAPSIDVAMGRSLHSRSIREGFANLVLASLRPVLGERDAITSITGQVSDVKTAFSSWSNCMQAAYCKWPVIALIIIGGLIIFSVLWCIIRCACCGLSCCCSCFRCLSCCGCTSCCEPRGGRRHKYLDEPFIPPNQGYKAAEPMNARAAPTIPFSSAPAAVHVARPAEPPQYAEFDVSKKSANPDALPAMPSWENAENKKVLVEEEVEMDTLKKPATNGQNVPLMSGAGASPGPASPNLPPNRSPYLGAHGAGAAASSGYFPPGATGAGQASPTGNGYYGNGAPGSDPYGLSAEGYGQQGGAYGSAPNLGMDQGYGAGGYGAAGAAGQGRQSPRAYNNNNGGWTSAPPRTGTPNQGGYAPPARSGTPNQGYARPGQSAYNSYGQQQAGYQSQERRSPNPQSYADDYGNNGNSYASNQPYAAERQYSSDSTRPLVRPAPTRQYSQDVPSEPSSGYQSNNNNNGFDFNNAGYSRPQADAYGRRPSPSNANQPYGRGPSAGATQQPSGGYPGYKPYQNASQW